MTMAPSPRWWLPWQRHEAPPPPPEPQPEQQAEQADARALRHDYLKVVNRLALTTEVARERFDRLGDAMDAIDVHLQYVWDSARRDENDGPADSGGSADAGHG